MSTHNLCLRAKIRKQCLPLYTQILLYNTCTWVYISRTCLHDAVKGSPPSNFELLPFQGDTSAVILYGSCFNVSIIFHCPDHVFMTS